MAATASTSATDRPDQDEHKETSKSASSMKTRARDIEGGEDARNESVSSEKNKVQERLESQEDNDEDEDNEEEDGEEGEVSAASPLPDEKVPPLPNEAPPGQTAEDDGWEPVWDGNAQAYYFYNRFTRASQWENPRVRDAPTNAPGTAEQDTTATSSSGPVAGGYNPAIHGDYDPTAPYAQQPEQVAGGSQGAPGVDPSQMYAATGTFNRFTGKWQAASLTPENFNDENKSRRQMNAYFDVDAAANSHDGRSLKAERSGKKLSKKELKAFREKRRERKEEKRRAWLRD